MTVDSTERTLRIEMMHVLNTKTIQKLIKATSNLSNCIYERVNSHEY